ncbi:MAG: hypothetical protein EOP48_22915, partial [Sphingobacteriales bacterium]
MRLVLSLGVRFNAPMMKNIPLYVGLRYTRAKRRNQFISFISAFSLVGMALGVMALIIVLSVMNGFDREMKQRLLSVVPHGFIDRYPHLENWQDTADKVKQHPKVIGTAPYVAGDALISYAGGIQGIQLQGVLPDEESKISVIDQHMLLGSLAELRQGEFGIVMGSLLARSLGLALGDKVVITSPDINIKRVRNRVKKGGHNVPDDKIIERYHRSLSLLAEVIPHTYRSYIFDNSGQSYRLISEIEQGHEILLKDSNLPSLKVFEKLGFRKSFEYLKSQNAGL